MKQTFYLFIFVLAFLSCSKKQDKETITEKKAIREKIFITDSVVYKIVNTVLELPEFKKDSTKYMLNTGNIFIPPPSIIDDGLYHYINKNFGNFDSFDFDNQILKSRDSYYKQKFIKSHQLIDYDLTTPKTREQFDSLRNHIQKNYRNHISVSLPFFVNDNVVFISYQNIHSQEEFFMKKINGKWEYYEYFSKAWE